MAASTQRDNFQFRTFGRSFASADPERQREVMGYVRPSPLAQPASERTSRAPRMDWMRVQPDRDSSTYEGGSSRRSR